MRAIIHAGMHKTGSSAIQKAMHEHTPDGVYYPDWSGGNHGGLIALLFHEPVESHHGFQRAGKSRPELLDLRRDRMRRLVAECRARKGDTLILSAEFISGAHKTVVQAMRDFLMPLVSDVRVIAYVRAPVSLMQSTFQERIKSRGLAEFQPVGLWPNYRAKLEKLDEVFGAGHVSLRKFRRDTLKDGDVVADFCDFAGVEMPGEHLGPVNESLSLEATALLYAQRKLGDGFVSGFRGAAARNNAFIAALSAIGSAQLAFSPDLVAPVLDANRADLDWVERRLGAPLAEPTRPEGPTIGSEADLLAVAEANRGALEELLVALIHSETAPPGRRLARNLDLLRKVFY